MSSSERKPTLADVASRAGVSPTTVSRALNGRGYVSRAMQERIDEAVTELGYLTNHTARTLRGKATQTVGLIIPTLAMPFFGELAVAVENALAKRDYRMLVCNSLGKPEREKEYLDLLLGQHVDGIISSAHNENVCDYSMLDLPVVSIDRNLHPSIPIVRCDNYDGARQATQLLLDRGARRPALLTSRMGPHNLREKGYRHVLEQAGIEPLVMTVSFNTPQRVLTETIRRELDTHPEVDSVFATDDLRAATAYEWALQHGFEIPDDFKVIGFDGTFAMRQAMPWLSTVIQPINQMAQHAVELLVEQVDCLDLQRDQFPADIIELPIKLYRGRTV
ncbi:MAG: LacI family DNA-binding transcriptional regulator [Actinomyces graevenitzii]|uniref:LacI family DNA-binding transcriptional regulator n=1 Tax=Actinomyces graevenitzii TaxID=55565 RepID=A0A9E7ANE8_9ACTO|nr:LacI family DNA-binding transcriptional regulator [Actinomyces graevenitzii]MBS4943004.1 LacI family DNA-binding transcriptional regulator [Actinomyces graevenitzii]MBS5245144.1 LacI family DNA-binding transcriptional regulator [Actinomyces graevenitzii]MBS6670974.1 LacI family DNA-binding transcriptional regulator [Actinomyces graevenitzii]UQF80527.1 MAG: LacI family DNA-binding transcriptional regulator [Actinomyces graevenitzii]